MADAPAGYFIDANVLVFASIARAPLHMAAVRTLNQLWESGSQGWISRQVLREYLSVVTRPDCPPQPLPLSAALSTVNALSATLRVADETAATSRILCELLARYRIQGRRVHDCNIVATMLDQQIPCLLTNNVADFKMFEGLISILPLR